MMVGSDYSQDSSVAFSFVQTTCSRSGGFSRDWADLAGATLHWVGRNVLSVCDFTISKEFYMLNAAIWPFTFAYFTPG